jgi:hypothetical protein
MQKKATSARSVSPAKKGRLERLSVGGQITINTQLRCMNTNFKRQAFGASFGLNKPMSTADNFANGAS